MGCKESFKYVLLGSGVSIEGAGWSGEKIGISLKGTRRFCRRT